MFFSSWLRKPNAKPRTVRRATSTFRPRLEVLEDRMLPSTYYAATAADLIADINAANKAGGANTIALTAPTTSHYVVSGLSVAKKDILKTDILTIIGNGDTLDAN